jgi:hypothetical protein
VYPAVEGYLCDFFRGVASQSDTSFSVVVASDGVAGLEKYRKSLAVPMEVFPVSGTPAAARKSMLARLAQAGYDAVVMTDADDVCGRSVVAVSRSLLERERIVATDLRLWFSATNTTQPWLAARLGKEGCRIDLDTIRDANACGCGNTAAWLCELTPHLECIADETLALDWALFTRALADGNTVWFSPAAHTRYRQHDANIAGPLDLGDEAILRGVRVKAQHYGALDGDSSFSSRRLAFQDLERRLTEDLELRNTYCTAVRRNRPVQPLWWEAIKPLEELVR